MVKIFSLFLLFAFVLFVSCDSDDKTAPIPSEWLGDWNYPSNPNYVPGGYNPVEGEWRVVSCNDTAFNDILIHKFTTTRKWQIAKSISKKTKKPEYGEAVFFKINSTQILTGIFLHSYTITNDTVMTLIEKDKMYSLRPF